MRVKINETVTQQDQKSSSQREAEPSAWKGNCHLGVSNQIPEPGELSTTSGSSHNCPDMTRPYYFNTILKNAEVHLACCPVTRNTRFSKTIKKKSGQPVKFEFQINKEQSFFSVKYVSCNNNYSLFV
ncbi:unnamed protein product [Rangifer tarandus platyrhynchus]|uniref:Uncharacterized protein n=2 Tax=Rangifer tarandus platyrhynchus TaxID=3082113 RepID=A0ABN8ZBB8_RANTA|nr:unnamed protein product [Rangifer tarandus platyrhynchus]